MFLFFFIHFSAVGFSLEGRLHNNPQVFSFLFVPFCSHLYATSLAIVLSVLFIIFYVIDLCIPHYLEKTKFR
jgi:hypothetical protein